MFQYVKETITIYRLLCYYLSNSNAKIQIIFETFVKKTENFCWFMLF